MPKMIQNRTSTLKRTIPIRSDKGGTTTATIERIGTASMGRDGRYWSMVYATTLGGAPVAFAAVNDGAPAWMR